MTLRFEVDTPSKPSIEYLFEVLHLRVDGLQATLERLDVAVDLFGGRREQLENLRLW